MKKVDSSGWKGEGGDAFREKFGVHPTRWASASSAKCAAASSRAARGAVRGCTSPTSSATTGGVIHEGNHLRVPHRVDNPGRNLILTEEI
ncbi:putative T7SS-secreted protein [Streptomyces sp. 900105245]